MSPTRTAPARRLLHTTRMPRAVRELNLAALRLRGRLAGVTRPPCEPEHLRIVALTPTYLPNHPSGSEVTLHRVLHELHERGHETRVLVDEGVSCTIDGVEVIADADNATTRSTVEWANVVLAHLTARGAALRLSARHDRPLVFYMQIGNTPRHAYWGDPDLTVFNSAFVAAQFPWIERSLVLHPPVDPDRYRVTPGEAITLINLTDMKGGNLFFDLAARLPDRKFLGVRGWGTQVEPARIPPNVEIAERRDDVRSIYEQTRVLLVPSGYEAYGRVCLEAAVSGIPAIAHPNGGVREAIGDAALWADRADPDAWVAQIRALDDPAVYTRQSELARHRITQLDPVGELDAFEDAIRALAGCDAE